MKNTKFKECVSRITMEARKAALKEYKPDPASDGVINFDIDLYHQKIVEMVVQKCIKTLQDKEETYGAYLLEKHFGVNDED